MLLRRVTSEGNWSLIAVCSDRGDCPLLEFFEEIVGSLARDQIRMLALLDHVRNVGPRGLPLETSHQIDDNIFQFTRGRLRVLWFYDHGNIVICSHGFVKKSQKTPTRERERARTSREKYFRDKGAGKLFFCE